MTKIKVFKGVSDKDVNKFIKDKDVLSIAYFPEKYKHYSTSYAVTYRDKSESRTCSTCKWWQDEVCVNGDSPLCSDFTVAKFGCVLWETR